MERELKLSASVRLTLLSSCQSGCTFCHLEGFKTSGEIGKLNSAIEGWKSKKEFDNAASLLDVDRAINVARALRIRNVNITGGEPTLHPSLSTVIRRLDEADLSVAITTHAEIAPSQFAAYLNRHLDWVIISIHALEPRQYLEMDLVAQRIAEKHGFERALQFAAHRLENKKANLRQALSAQRAGVIDGVITNTVMLEPDQAIQIITYCAELGIMPRIQRDLNFKERSQTLLDEVIQRLGAQVVGVQQAIGDSSGSGVDYVYLDPNSRTERRFRLKDFGEVYVPAMCASCDMRATDACRERFYGVRVEQGRVRTCIDREIQSVTVFEADDFLSQMGLPDSIPNAIYRQYSDAMRVM